MNATKECFHVNSPCHWAKFPKLVAGQKLEIGGDVNPFFKFFDTPAQIRKKVGVDDFIPMMEVAMELSKDAKFHAQPLALTFETLMHVGKMYREILVEMVRATQFPELPSRQKCIWLVDSVEEAEQFVKLRKIPNYQIVKVKAEGSHHVADERFLPFGYSGYSDEVKLVERYWKGERSAGPNLERLFVGSVEVLEVAKVVGRTW